MSIKYAGAVAAFIAGVCLVSGPPPAAHAQDTLSVAARLVMRQPAGAVLRVNAGREQVTGVLDRVDAGTLYLDEPPRALLLSSITNAWLQRRSTGRGGRIGAAIGAPSGAALFGLAALVLSGPLCETDCDDSGTGDIVVASLAGAAAGAASGYIVGALIGASVTRWEPLTESSAPATIVVNDPRRHAGLSAFNVTPAVARAAAGDDAVGAGFALSYLTQLSRHIALGGEGAKYDVIAEQYTFFMPCDDDPQTLCTRTHESRGVWHVGGLARIGTGAERMLEPYVLLGLGVTDFGELRLGGYSAGAGTRYRVGGGRFAVSGEARWHSHFTSSGDDSQLGFYTIGVGLSLLR